MKYTLIALACLMIHSMAFAVVARSYDQENGCTLYQSVPKDEQGNVKLTPKQTIFLNKEVYGLSFHEMEIDFDRKEVAVELRANVILGLNRPLLEKKVLISDSNKNFNYLVNQLNRSISLFEKACINSKNEVVYALMYKNDSERK